jgi:5-methyltetrahydrofolate--homocysteine methyltransferase
VGERTNVIGSRKFKELAVAERFDDAEVGRAQVKAGAQVLDVCLANPVATSRPTWTATWAS